MRFLKTASRTALLCGLATLVAAPAYAQPAPKPDMDQPGHHRMMPDWGKHGAGMHRGMRPGRVNLMAFGCGDRAAERLEVALVRLGYRVDLTDTQKPLFETLKTSALTEQTKVADACAAAMPKDAAAKPDVVDHMKARLSVETARVAALEKVVPEFEAFFDSLSADQKTKMAPRRMRMGMMEDGKGMGPDGHHHRKGMDKQH